MDGCPLRLEHLMPFLRDFLERAFGRLAIRLDGQLLYDGRVFAFIEDRAGFVSLLPRLHKADHRIDAEVHALLHSVIGIVPAPELPTARLNEKIEAVAEIGRAPCRERVGQYG